MKNHLILITRQFPYGYKETFLESEIEIISKYFDTIIIYPSTNHSVLRKLPANVFVNDLICKDYTSKLKWILKTIFTLDFFFILIKHLNKMKSRRSIKSMLKYIVSYTIYKNKINIINSENDSSLIYSYWYSPFVDAFCNQRVSKKIITRVHGGDLYEERSDIGLFPNRDRTIHNVNQIFSISNHGVDYIKKKYKINHVTLSRLGIIDMNRLSNCSPKNRLSIVSVSDIIPIKNLPLIAKSIIHFARVNPNVEILWNHFGSGEGKQILENIISLEKSENFHCKLQGIVKNSEVLNFYISNPVDLFINLSETEGIPVSMMEAISFGIPIIGTNVGGVSEIVNEITGILIEHPINIEYVASQIGKIYSSPKNRELIRKFFIENYSAELNFSMFGKELFELCQR
jgi:glycosyltransferase involved in cell wall biosynthesis